MGELRRRWVLAPVLASLVTASGAAVRSTCRADDELLAGLLDRAYDGTIDFDPDADHAEELRTWRRVDGANDRASTVAVVGDVIIGACLIGAELGSPFLYEIVVAPEARRAGVGAQLLRASTAVLASEGPDHLAAWVTHGNIASERLLTVAGFRPVTDPLDQSGALAIYRAARLLDSLDVPAGFPAAVQLAEYAPVLWIVGAAAADRRAELAGVEITIRSVARDDPRVSLLAGAVPLRGAASLLGDH